MPQEIEYSPQALQRLTTRLRRRAIFVLVLWLIIGVLVGAYIGFGNGGRLAAVIGAAAGTLLGYLIGSMRSFYYNVQAMNALCLGRIVENTRTR